MREGTSATPRTLGERTDAESFRCAGFSVTPGGGRGAAGGTGTARYGEAPGVDYAHGQGRSGIVRFGEHVTTARERYEGRSR